MLYLNELVMSALQRSNEKWIKAVMWVSWTHLGFSALSGTHHAETCSIFANGFEAHAVMAQSLPLKAEPKRGDT